MKGVAEPDGPPVRHLPSSLLELTYERSQLHDWGRYDPRQDLKRRTGVDLLWHNDSADFGTFTGKVRGITNFTKLSVSLHVHLSEVQLRCTLAHECAHLDRGPVTAERTRREEQAVHKLAAKRLIDPVLFDALMEATDGAPGKHARYLVLGVDAMTLEVYASWRKGVTETTALRRWEKAVEPSQWPPRWLTEKATGYPIAAQFAGLMP